MSSMRAALLLTVSLFSSSIALSFQHIDYLNLPQRQAQFLSTLPVGGSKRAGLPVDNATHPFWLYPSSEVNPLANEGSEGPLTNDADVCIIGSGITGISAAYHLSHSWQPSKSVKSLSVAIFEARDFCSGATGRNGGHLTPNTFKGFRANVDKYGVQEAIRQILIERYTVDEITKLLTVYNMSDSVDLVKGGHIDLHFTEEEGLDAFDDYLSASNSKIDTSLVQFYNKTYVFEHYKTNFSAVMIPGYNVWPLKLVTFLFQMANNRSLHSSDFKIHLHTHTPIVSVDEASNSTYPWVLQTERGPVSCRAVLHATNGYASYLLPELVGPKEVVPTRGQVIGVRSNASADTITRVGWGAGSEANARKYWFPRPIKHGDDSHNPLILIGGGKEVTGPSFERYITDDSAVRKDVTKVLRDFLPETFTSLYPKEAVVEYEWTGILGYTAHDDPFVGPLVLSASDESNGQFIAAGYSGHGMPRAYACAEVAAEMILHHLRGLFTTWTPPSWLPHHYLTWVAWNESLHKLQEY